MEQSVAIDNMPKFGIAIGAIFILCMVFFGLVVTALTIWAYCKIFHKAGYCWVLGLLMLVPIANIVMPLVLAFSDWPVLRELRALRQQPEPGT